MVEKETVPVERVRLGTEKVTEEHEVSETVRKEQIEEPGPPRTLTARHAERACTAGQYATPGRIRLNSRSSSFLEGKRA